MFPVIVRIGRCMQTKYVLPTDPLSVIFDGKDCFESYVFYNKYVLQAAFSFQFYNIKNGDELLLMPKQNNEPKRHTIEISNAEFERRIKERIDDNYIRMIEGYKRCGRYLSRKYGELSRNQEEKEISEIEHFIPLQLTEPSTKALPILWEETSD